MYKLIYDPITKQTAEVVIRLADMALIPIADGNTDYQQFLAWIAEGNVPEEA
jgi:hypothetical protein